MSINKMWIAVLPTPIHSKSFQGAFSMTGNLQPIPAYVYKITCRPTGQYYFGFRTQNIKKKYLPEEDLWVNYFTSSIYVHKLIKEYNSCSFDYVILFKTTDIYEAYWFEQDLISQHIDNPLCINKHYRCRISGHKMFNTAGTPSPVKGRPSPLKGRVKGSSPLTGRSRPKFKGQPSGRKGEKWWNNGIDEVRSFEQPDGYSPGRMYKGHVSPCKGRPSSTKGKPSPRKGIPSGRKGIPNLKNKGRLPASAGKPNPYKGKSTKLKGRKFENIQCPGCCRTIAINKLTWHSKRCDALSCTTPNTLGES
jgi:hypothetical protein